MVTAALLLSLLMPASAYAQDKSGEAGVYEQLNLFGEAFDRIRQDAVDPVADKKLIDTAIAGMLASLDARSVYLNETQYKALKSPAEEQAASIGLVVTIVGGQLKVVSPRYGSPAAKAGIAPDDLIYEINKEPTYELTLSQFQQKLRGPAGSTVELLVRHGTDMPKTIKVTRAAGPWQTVSDHVEAGDIGYIRISGFDNATQDALTTAIQDIRQKTGNKLIGYILDLRDNPGGNFDVAVTTADDFLDKGDIAVVKSRNPDLLKRISATPGDLANGLPIVALVNGGTARGAELVAGALQDNHRAVLLGTKTFGESAIVTLIPLPGNNGAIRLTTARFQTPSGRVIQGMGLDPDLDVSSVKLHEFAEEDRQHEADLPGALKNPNPVLPIAGGAAPPPVAENAPVTLPHDEQLAQAVDVLKGLALVSAHASGH
jgi:carboxyl-terminal processing protease